MSQAASASSTLAHSVAAVIPHWNRADLVNPLLGNLALQSQPFREIVVVDNGSTDGSAEVAEQAGARVIRLDRNEGFAAAVNRGIEALPEVEWVAILNNDVTLDPEWLKELLTAALRENMSFATGKILSARDHNVLDGAWDEISRGACAARCGAGGPVSAKFNRPRVVRMVPMTAAIFRRELFQEVGPLDERFVSYLEDVDFGLRCAKHKRQGLYQPTAVAYHQGSATWGRWKPETVRQISRNQLLLAVKHFGQQPRWPILAGQWLWGLVALRHGCGWAWLRGKWAGWQARTSMPNDTHDAARFAAILRASEAELLGTQRETSNDLYWRLYAWLAPPR